MYAYCQNDSVNLCDPSGYAATPETILDVAGLVWSAYDFYNDPSWLNAAFLLWDVASIAVPIAPGSYTYKGLKYGADGLLLADNIIAAEAKAAKAAAKALTVGDIFKALKATSKADDFAKAAKAAAKATNMTTTNFSKVLADKHLWNKVLKNVSVSEVTELMAKTIKKGVWNTYKSGGAVIISYKYKGEIVQVTGKVINGVLQVSDAWVMKR
jgi:hypothetical protein